MNIVATRPLSNDDFFAEGKVVLINYATRIYFGFGAIEQLGAELARSRISRPMIVTDKGVLRLNQGRSIIDKLPKAAVFDGTPANPTEGAARAGAMIFAKEGCNGIVALGGGSPMDLAKAIALVASHSGSLDDYALVNGGLDKIRPVLPPVIAIPTTAGTGSEVARASVLILESGAKKAIASPHMIPCAAICDPCNTLAMPPLLTATTGFDAIAHCVEAYCSPNVNPPADAIALDGLQRALGYLERAVSNGGDREARWQMLMASLEGGLVFQKGLGAVHALSHPLGELGFHHGTLNAILLPHVLAFNAPYIEYKLDRLAAAAGQTSGSDVPRMFADLLCRMGIPPKLRDIGFRSKHIDTVAAKATIDSCSPTNPRPMNKEDYATVLGAAF